MYVFQLLQYVLIDMIETKSRDMVITLKYL